jgi:citrate synthase
MADPTDAMRTDMGWSTTDRITVRGLDLPSQILGRLNLGDVAFLELTGRLPNERESAVFNAIAITLVEHGITPSAIAARMTYLGAPEAMQAAVAAGLSGLGNVFVGSTQSAAKLLQDALATTTGTRDLEAIAKDIVANYRARKAIIPGIGHPIHKPIDPRTPRLFEIAEQNGFRGDYVRLMVLIAEEAEKASGKSRPVNATGAIAALASELGLTPEMCKGIAVFARAIGLVGHIVEEAKAPMAAKIWHQVDAQATRHVRPDKD